MDQSGDGPLLTTDIAAAIDAADRLPSPSDQMDLLVAEIAARQASPGEPALVNLAEDRALIGAASATDLSWVLDALETRGLANITGRIGPNPRVLLTIDGWLRVEEVRKGRTSGAMAFMAMQYGETELEELFAQTLQPAVARTGFDLVRLIDRPPAGLIDVRMRAEIRRARFVIAELTHSNAGAYWEAGFAEGLAKPVIYLCEREHFETRRTHFDTNHSHHVLWNRVSPQDCAEELVATIRATLPSEARMEG